VPPTRPGSARRPGWQLLDLFLRSGLGGLGAWEESYCFTHPLQLLGVCQAPQFSIGCMLQYYKKPGSGCGGEQ
jgi:hypothetical protein